MSESAKKKILLIEDEEILSSILTEKLTRAGYEVVVAFDGMEGVQKLHEVKPDLVLLDMMLPKLNGYGVLEKMEEAHLLPDLPVIVISNSGQKVEIERALHMGIRDYLVKLNFDPDEVLEKVQAQLEDEGAAPPAAKDEMAKDDAVVEMPVREETVDEGKQTIMVVEDDMFIADLLARKLHDVFNVHQAADTAAAEEILKNHKVDLICLDVMLPGEDGFSFLARLKEMPEYKDIPVVILSNLGQQEEIEKGINAGAADYLVKANMAPHEIKERIVEILAHRK